MRLRLGGAHWVAVVAGCAGTPADWWSFTRARTASWSRSPTPRLPGAAGLMRRDTLAADQGMLFVYPQAARHCLWMRNTTLPLSTAFLDDDGVVINIADMAPQSDTRHCAAAAARYALGMNAGWFQRHCIEVGMRIAIPAAISAW